MDTIGGRLKNRLRELGISQKELSEKLNISQSTLNGYIRDYREPDLKTLIKITKVLFTPINELLGVTDEPRPTSDYLLTGIEPPPKELTADEAEWLELYRKLEPSEKLEHRAELKGYVKAKEKMK